MKHLKGAIIGFGNITADGHWPTYAASREVEIVAVVEPSEARGGALEKRPLRCANGVAELLSNERLDFVDICTPPASHALLTSAALSHGVHVLCEKPLTLSPVSMLHWPTRPRSRERPFLPCTTESTPRFFKKRSRS